MANYILKILKSQITIVWSWGFHNPTILNNGLAFMVRGYKFIGKVEVRYNEGKDLFTVSLIKNGKVEKQIDDVYFDSLINVIDGAVERVDNYSEKVKQTYSII